MMLWVKVLVVVASVFSAGFLCGAVWAGLGRRAVENKLRRRLDDAQQQIFILGRQLGGPQQRNLCADGWAGKLGRK